MIGDTIIELASVDSTNAYAASAEFNDGTVIWAHNQFAGRGQHDRQWLSEAGKNLTFTVVLKPVFLAPDRQFQLNKSIALGVLDFVHSLLPHSLQIKWPNDIYCKGKKLGGILIEIAGETEGPCAAVIGLGLNLFLPDAQAQSITQAWTDLSKVTGQTTIERNRLAGELLNQLLSVLAEFESIGINAYLDEWRRYDCLKDHPATLFIGEQPFVGVVRGINDNGLLLLEHSDGKLQAFASGEVSFNRTVQ